MNVIRFQENKEVTLGTYKVRNRVISVQENEGYLINPRAIGFIIKSSFFGFWKPKKHPIVSVRENCGTPLMPLETSPDYMEKEPVSQTELRNIDNSFFLEARLKAQKGSGGDKDWVKRALGILAIAFGGVFLSLMVLINIPKIKESLGGAITSSQSLAQQQDVPIPAELPNYSPTPTPIPPPQPVER